MLLCCLLVSISLPILSWSYENNSNTCTINIFRDRFMFIITAPPVLTASPSNKTINEGESLVLKCAASVLGKRIPVKWFKNNVPLVISKSGDYFVGSKGHLVFLTVHFDDRGAYKCVAKNEAGRVSGTAYLTVRAKIKQRGNHIKFYNFS